MNTKADRCVFISTRTSPYSFRIWPYDARLGNACAVSWQVLALPKSLGTRLGASVPRLSRQEGAQSVCGCFPVFFSTEYL